MPTIRSMNEALIPAADGQGCSAVEIAQNRNYDVDSEADYVAWVDDLFVTYEQNVLATTNKTELAALAKRFQTRVRWLWTLDRPRMTTIANRLQAHAARFNDPT